MAKFISVHFALVFNGGYIKELQGILINSDDIQGFEGLRKDPQKRKTRVYFKKLTPFVKGLIFQELSFIGMNKSDCFESIRECRESELFINIWESTREIAKQLEGEK